MNPLWHPRTGSTAFRPQLAAATELLVIDFGRFLPQFFPDPHSIGGLDRQPETQLVREHAYLTAVMGVMQDHVDNHGGAPGPRPGPTVSEELLDATLWAAQGFRDHFRTAQGTFPERRACLLLRAAQAIEVLRQADVGGGESQPLASDVVHMSENRGDCAHVSARRFCPPCMGIQILKN